MGRLIPRLISPDGYTMLELMIVAGIVFVLTLAGVATYRRFDEKQKFNQGVNEFMSQLRMVQKRADAGEKPQSGCATLDGYRVVVAVNGTAADTQRICNGAGVSVGSISLKHGVIFNTASSIDFLSGGKGVNSTHFVNFKNAAGNCSATLNIDTGGAMSLTAAACTY